MLSASQFCFAVFLATLYRAQQGESSSHFSNTEEFTGGGEGFRNYTRCGWNCAVIEKDLPKQSDSLFAKTSLIQLVVNYKTKVDKKCVNQPSRSSSGFATEDFEVWLPANNKLPSFANGIKSLKILIWGPIRRFKGKIKVVCNLKPTRTAAPSPTDVRVALQKSIEAMDFKIIIKKEGWSWSEISLVVMQIVCLGALLLYSPAFFCLFSPTIVTENGVRYIAIEGTSPVSFRALIGNNLFANDCTTWRDKASMLISRFVVLPLFFLPPVTVALHYLPSIPVFFVLHFTHPFVITALACLIIWAVYDSLSFTDVSHKAKRPCIFCRDVQKNFTCFDILPRRILSHLFVQIQILVYCWGWFLRSLVTYFKTIINCSLNCSTLWVIRIPLFITLVSTVPAITIVLLTILLILLYKYTLNTSPIFFIFLHSHTYTQTVNGGSLLNRLLRTAKRVGYISVALLAACGLTVIVSAAAFGILFMSFLALTIILLFPEESLPFVACFVLVFYYLFSSYSSFTDKYQDLSALTLFKCYKTSRQELCTEPVKEVTHRNSDNNSNVQVLKIPKKLFDMACEELMPIKEGVCILVLKVTLILGFVFVVFSLTMRLDVGASPLTKALVTFLTGTFPKIIAIYFNGEKQTNFQAIIIEEKAPKIVKEYLNRTQSANQREDNSDTNTTEVILNIENEENRTPRQW